MPMKPSGFKYVVRSGGDVVMTHHGRVAGTLRGSAAEEFLAEAANAGEEEQQHIMARYTGNYRRGNERRARRHPRNQ